jgi:hypothetical protein
MTALEITAGIEGPLLTEFKAIITNVIRNFKAENYESF